MNENHDFEAIRAEAFDAIGHPTRIRILQALGEKSLTFSDLKRLVGIESSGHMSFHLGKLKDLVKTTPDGAYVLTDDGREALRIIGEMRNEGEMTKNQKRFFNGLFVGAGIGLISGSIGTIHILQQLTGIANIDLLASLILIIVGVVLEFR